ncbi:MAG: TonB-dependent receptor [Muribaculaceae bacterium]|nr:TonB-dependent receptor [Muribaculaceae bacterium]
MTKNLHVKTWAMLMLAGLVSTGTAKAASSPAETMAPQQRVEQGTGVLSGTVIDSEGEPLVGATIMVDGTNLATTADIDGQFNLRNVPIGSKVSIRYVGYKTVSLKWTGAPLVVTMEADNAVLDELIVVGYGTQKKVDLTGAVSAVSGEVLEGRPVTNVGQALQGVIGNLTVNPGSGAPGSTSSFNVRGVTSISSDGNAVSNGPLVLVDNVPMDINLVNPDDIEQISVLKDGSSAAIYGARAAYGVILITTKRGKAGEKPTVSFSANLYWSDAVKSYHRVNSLQYINMYDEAQVNSGGSPVYAGTLQGQYVEDYFYGRYNSPVFIDPANTNGKYTYCGNTDWWNELYKSSFNQNYNINVSGGTGKTTYYASLGLFDQGTNRVGADENYKRWNAKVSVNTQITNWLNIGANITNSYTSQKHPTGSGNSGITNMGGVFKADLSPLVPVRHPDGNYAGQGDTTNPIAMQELGGTSKWKYNDLWLTGIIRLTPIEGLSIQADYTWNYYSANSTLHATSYLEYGYPGGYEGYYPWSLPSYVQYSTTNDYYQSFNAFAEYRFSFLEDKNNFVVMAGYNQERKVWGGFWARRQDLITNDMWMLSQGTGNLTANNNSTTQYATNSVFFRVNYDFEGKYLAEFTGRYDGTSKFPKGHRYGFFPSGSVAWRISQEKFFEGVSHWWSNLKLRASYGRLGNMMDLSSNFPYLLSYGINSNYGYLIDGSTVTAVTAPGLVSGNLTWEKVDQFDIGLDFSFFNNRLVGEFDWFSRTTKDALVAGQTLPSVLGTNVPQENSASIRTQGWELSLSWQDRISSCDLGYYVRLSLSDNHAKVIKYDNNSVGYIGYLYPGKNIGEIWGFRTDGLYQSEQEIADYQQRVDLSEIAGVWNPGDVKYVDSDGDGKISDGDWTLDNPGDNVVLGNSTPRYAFGATVGLTWKGFDFEMFWQGVGKRDLPWNSAINGNDFFPFTNQWQTPTREAYDYWREDNPDAYFARIYVGNGTNQNYKNYTPAGNPNDRYLLNMAYGRLKNIVLGYTLPTAWTSKAGISKVRFYVQGENLVTISDSKKFCDPETSGFLTYPTQKKVSVGVNVTF